MADLHTDARHSMGVSVSDDLVAGAIAINYEFQPHHLQSDKGVAPDASETDIAGEVLVPAVLAKVGQAARVLPVSRWIERERLKRQGGKPGPGLGYWRLTADLLGVPLTDEFKQRSDAKALKRALERSGAATKEGRTESHKGALSEQYQRLIGDLRGGERGNPFVPLASRARRMLRHAKAQLEIWGDWKISQRFYRFTKKGTDQQPAVDFQRVWDNPRAFLEETLATIEETWLDNLASPELLKVYGYSIVIDLKP